MKTLMKRILFWTPRILCILFAGFISLFALDALSENAGFWGIFLAFLIHLLPTVLIVSILMLSWRWEWIGGILYNLLGIVYMVMALQHPTWILAISGPLFLIGTLFLVGFYTKQTGKN